MRLISILFLFVSFLAACSNSKMRPDIPALLTNPGAETLQEIEQTVATALDGKKVTLSPDTLTNTSMLTIERGLQRSVNRPPELGRDLGRPDHFQLVIDGPQCVLVDLQSGLHWLLATVECVEE